MLSHTGASRAAHAFQGWLQMPEKDSEAVQDAAADPAAVEAETDVLPSPVDVLSQSREQACPKSG